MATAGTYNKPVSTRARRRPDRAARDLDGAYLVNGRLATLDDSRDVLERSARAWEALDDFRERRRTNRDYLFGDQWSEPVTKPDGTQITEREAIEAQGREPWEMNRVRPIIRNLEGQLRQNESDRQVFAVNREDNEAARVMTQALREARKINEMPRVEAHQFLEHLLAGRAAFRVGYKYMSKYGRPEVVIDPVNSLRLFYNPDLNDPRGRDLSLIGQLHDMELEEVVNAFAPRSEELAEAIRDYYGSGPRRRHRGNENYGFPAHDGLNFRTPTNTDLCRVIEAWRAGKTPFKHGEHPFVMGFGDFLDGEARGLMDDLIDQQRLYNRMVQIMDLGMSTSARGVLMIPEEMIPEGMSIEEFADEYQKVNGTIVYQATTDEGEPMPAQHAPQHVFSQSIPAGAFEWLEMMNQEMRDASGVKGPVMGDAAKSDTPASLYNQQIVQSQLTNLDQFESYFETLHNVDLKAVKVAAQFHQDGRRVRGEGDEGVMEFNKEQIQSLEFDVSVAQVSDTATYRQLWEDDLKEMLGAGLLTFRQYLKVSSHPRADELLELIQRMNPLVEEGGEGSPAEQAKRQGASPEIQRALKAAEAGSKAAGQNMSPEARRQLRARLIQQAEENNDRRAQALLAQAA